MMDNAPNLLGFRQHVLQIAPQPGWVLAIPVAVGRRPVQHSLNALPQHLRCLRLGQPKRLEHAQHQPSVNLCDRQLSELRIGIALERVEPVLPIRGAFPCRAMIVETGLDAFFEGLVPRHFQGTPGFFCLPPFEGILANLHLLPNKARPLTCFLQRECMQGTKTQHSFFAVALISENPGSVRWARHLKIQTVSVAIAAGFS